MNISKIKRMVNNMPWALNRIAEPVAYKSWDKETIRRLLKESLDTFMKEFKEAGEFDFDKIGELDGDLLYDIGFKVWSEMEDGDLWVFPLWMFDYIPKGMKLVSIGGETIEFDPETTDNDNRFGCIAYGLVLPKEKYAQLKARAEKAKAEEKSH